MQLIQVVNVRNGILYVLWLLLILLNNGIKEIGEPEIYLSFYRYFLNIF